MRNTTGQATMADQAGVAGIDALAVRVTDSINMAGIWLPVRIIPSAEKPDAQQMLNAIQGRIKITKLLGSE